MAITDRSLISKQELAKRWGVSEGHITKLEGDGVLHRTDIGRCTFSMREVARLEGIETEPEYLAYRYKEMEKELAKATQEVQRLRRFKDRVMEMANTW